MKLSEAYQHHNPKNDTSLYICPFQPFDKQQQFLGLDCLEAFYGGAAGGGKSDALLFSASQYVDQSEYRAIIFRRTTPLLEQADGLIPRSHEFFGDFAKWKEQNKWWVFPSGAQIAFGHMENKNDYYRYKGGQYHFVGFDELTEFLVQQYLYMFSRMRRKKAVGSRIPIRMRSTSNPDGIGFEWVKQRFIVEGVKNQIPFIFANFRDNPYLDQDEYLKSLDKLDPVTRARLLEGNWEIREPGRMFRREWFATRIIDACPPPIEFVKIVRFWDLAATEDAPGKDPDFTASTLMGLHKDGRFMVINSIKLRGTPQTIKKTIKTTTQMDAINYGLVSTVVEQEGGASGVWTIDDIVLDLAGFVVSGRPSRRDKKERAAPFSSQCESGHVWLICGPWITDWMDSHEAFPTQGIHDDDVDSTSGAFGELTLCNVGSYPELPTSKSYPKSEFSFRKDAIM